MLNIIRLKIAKCLVKKASACIRKGDYRNIRKGLRYFMASVRMIPIAEGNYDEWAKIRDEMYELVKPYM